jgi:hypothetical protein
MTNNNNKGIECKCEEDHNGNCYFCGRNMLSSPLTMEDWEKEFRDYFDKTLKPKKPTIGNLDREILVDFIRKQISSAVSQALEEQREKIKSLRKTPLATDNNGAELYISGSGELKYNQVIDDVLGLLSNNK